MPQPGGGGASGLPYAASPAGIGFEVRIISCHLSKLLTPSFTVIILHLVQLYSFFVQFIFFKSNSFHIQSLPIQFKFI